MFQIAVKPLLQSQFIGGHFEARFRVLVNIHLFRCRRLRHLKNLLWTEPARLACPPFRNSPERYEAQEANWRTKKEVNSAGYPPADPSLGRAASIRTCFAARKRESESGLQFCEWRSLRITSVD